MTASVGQATRTGETRPRPMRIPDPIWAAVVAVGEDEGVPASEIGRQALAADPRVQAKMSASA